MGDTVFIVASSSEARERLARALAGQAFDIGMFESVAEFLDSIDRGAHGCAVVPADLPLGGARAVIEGLRHRVPRVPVVVVGCDDDLPAAVDLVKCGAAEFVEHPLRAGPLVRAVRRALAAELGALSSRGGQAPVAKREN